jgi:hypothetical protein
MIIRGKPEAGCIHIRGIVAKSLNTVTITFGSILKMNVRRVKQDSDDMTLAIPSGILPSLNADFDGDELNGLYGALDPLEPIFEGFNPRNMLINRVDNSIKTDLSPLENIAIFIFSDQ